MFPICTCSFGVLGYSRYENVRSCTCQWCGKKFCSRTHLTGDDSLSTRWSESDLVALCTICPSCWEGTAAGRSAVHPASFLGEGTTIGLVPWVVCFTLGVPIPRVRVWGRFSTPTSRQGVLMTSLPVSLYCLVTVLVPLDTVTGAW